MANAVYIMNIIDNQHLLSQQQINLLHSTASQLFKISGYQSLDDVLSSLNVNILIEPGIITRSIPIALNVAENFWRKETNRLESLIRDAKDKESAQEDYLEARKKVEDIWREKELWATMPLRGLYDSGENVIRLYPEEMLIEYNGTCVNALLISTLVHETMHAYFNRPRHKRFPYVYFVEEPLAEFGMLLYLYETGRNYYSWAYQDVSSKKTCYRYGAKLMDYHLQEGQNSSVRQYLESYKINLGEYAMLTLNQNGSITMPTNLQASGKYVFKAPTNLDWLCYDNPRLKKPIYWAIDESTRHTYITCTKHRYNNPSKDSLYPPHLVVHSEVFVDKNVLEFLIDEHDWLRLPGSDLPSIKNMKIDYRNPRYTFDSGVLIDKNTNTILGGLVTMDAIHIPEGPVAIEREAFFCHIEECWPNNGPSFRPNKIKFISVPNSVKSIDETAFIACDNAVLSLPIHLKGLNLNTNANIIYHF